MYYRHFGVYPFPNDDACVRGENRNTVRYSYSSVLLNVIYIGCGTVASDRVDIFCFPFYAVRLVGKCFASGQITTIVNEVAICECEAKMTFSISLLYNESSQSLYFQTDIKLHFCNNLRANFLE